MLSGEDDFGKLPKSFFRFLECLKNDMDRIKWISSGIDSLLVGVVVRLITLRTIKNDFFKRGL